MRRSDTVDSSDRMDAAKRDMLLLSSGGIIAERAGAKKKGTLNTSTSWLLFVSAILLLI